MKGLETLLIIGGIAIAGYWCFTSGPCKDLLGKKELASGPPNPTTGVVKGVKVSGDELAANQLRSIGYKPPTAAFAGWYP